MFPSYKFCDGQLTDYSEMEKEYRKNVIEVICEGCESEMWYEYT